jgi:hypothetical protein
MIEVILSEEFHKSVSPITIAWKAMAVRISLGAQLPPPRPNAQVSTREHHLNPGETKASQQSTVRTAHLSIFCLFLDAIFMPFTFSNAE